ncbi:prenyltransferase [Thiosulfativibrio zosterae]|uniref:1,4-dihydroxy-2-naphthoate octaprenyltransferase n=1 Tax=Thiosulfativibrio zosterae TaxID=2675053 RepID=A0A6F8PNF4_9GAMM|nr:prenyltransferase [Thiosulfativibrio zosterae]BBP43616.1 1,4-dihydroxy-2-naphthoate octaprenyltransferase [Thiosulfativibrio zosterae]
MFNKAIFKAVIGSMRPPFLVLTLAVISLAAALANFQNQEWSVSLFVLVLLGGLSAHIAVNMLNEYEDFHSGLDDLTVKTPFSGGSGSLQAVPEAAAWVLQMGWFFLGFVAALGVYFIALRGWGLLPLGLIGLLIVVAYTSKITKMPWLCLIAPGFAFGPLMVMGAYYVLTGEYDWVVFGVSLVPFFLVNNLLLLNQFPDASADKMVGRYNVLILLGSKASGGIFNLFLLSSYLVILFLVALEYLPLWALLGGLTLLMAVPLALKVRAYHDDLERLMPALGLNVAVNILTPLLIALGLFLAH